MKKKGMFDLSNYTDVAVGFVHASDLQKWEMVIPRIFLHEDGSLFGHIIDAMIERRNKIQTKDKSIIIISQIFPGDIKHARNRLREAGCNTDVLVIDGPECITKPPTIPKLWMMSTILKYK